jgi:hypothetical protein
MSLFLNQSIGSSRCNMDDNEIENSNPIEGVQQAADENVQQTYSSSNTQPSTDVATPHIETTNSSFENENYDPLEGWNHNVDENGQETYSSSNTQSYTDGDATYTTTTNSKLTFKEEFTFDVKGNETDWEKVVQDWEDSGVLEQESRLAAILREDPNLENQELKFKHIASAPGAYISQELGNQADSMLRASENLVNKSQQYVDNRVADIKGIYNDATDMQSRMVQGLANTVTRIGDKITSGYNKSLAKEREKRQANQKPNIPPIPIAQNREALDATRDSRLKINREARSLNDVSNDALDSGQAQKPVTFDLNRRQLVRQQKFDNFLDKEYSAEQKKEAGSDKPKTPRAGKK